MNALVAFRDDRAHTQEQRALGRPVTGRSGAIFLAGDDDQRCAVRIVAHGRVVDRHDLALVARHAALDARRHLVPDADVGEGAAHHHLVIAAPAAIAVELVAADLMLHQILARRAVDLDRPGRADVVGGDGVAQQRQELGVDDVGDGLRLHPHALEIGRVGDVGGAGAPLIGIGPLDLDRAPALVALVHLRIAALEHGPVDIVVHELADLGIARPDVL